MAKFVKAIRPVAQRFSSARKLPSKSTDSVSGSWQVSTANPCTASSEGSNALTLAESNWPVTRQRKFFVASLSSPLKSNRVCPCTTVKSGTSQSKSP